MNNCMCGALDCRSCHPESFVRIDDDWIYIDEDLMELIPQTDEDF
jgi:uncharacterized protein YchJ